MNENEKIIRVNNLKENFVVSLSDIYERLKKSINANNLQSVYKLSKIITKYYFKDLVA